MESKKGYSTKKGWERTHAEKAGEELLFCLTNTQASCDLQTQLRENKVGLILSAGIGVCLCWCVGGVEGLRIGCSTALASLRAATGSGGRLSGVFLHQLSPFAFVLPSPGCSQ